MKKTIEGFELPLGKRSHAYRFFEMLPAILSYGSLLLLPILSFFSPLVAAAYILIIIIVMFVKAISAAVHTIRGRHKLDTATQVDWSQRLADLEHPKQALSRLQTKPATGFEAKLHLDMVKEVEAHPTSYPKPSAVYNAVIVATYNEAYDVLQPTIQSLLETTYDKSHLIVVVAYEQRGGVATQTVVERLQREYHDKFFLFTAIQHPKDLPNEVVGKGGNITYAGKFLQSQLDRLKIPYKDVLVTTLDADNHPHQRYFDYVTYKFITHKDRKNLAYQPISLFLNNIWDAPAPMRVIATGNSFWNIISSMRPYSLRNFASHSQPMDALVEMNFWSTRTIVEDGHQYWRSYFFFRGHYAVLPLYVPIYQDAVLSDSYLKTLKAQFIQLRRWDYGASDVPYVARQVFASRKRRIIPFWAGFTRFIRLLDGHVTLASVSIIVAFGGWVPLLINGQAARSDVVVHQLPDVISYIQQVAMIGLFITIFLAFKMLPPRPERYKRQRNFAMVAQWVFMPVTAIVYSSFAALYSQGRLFIGKYLDRFDVTEKATQQSISKAKEQRKSQHHRQEKQSQ